MLKEHETEYIYREYTEEPLTVNELKALFKKLEETPRDLLRKRDAKTVGLKGDESDEQLIKLMAAHPTLLQRPILVDSQRAVVGRPVEQLQELL